MNQPANSGEKAVEPRHPYQRFPMGLFPGSQHDQSPRIPSNHRLHYWVFEERRYPRCNEHGLSRGCRAAVVEGQNQKPCLASLVGQQPKPKPGTARIDLEDVVDDRAMRPTSISVNSCDNGPALARHRLSIVFCGVTIQSCRGLASSSTWRPPTM